MRKKKNDVANRLSLSLSILRNLFRTQVTRAQVDLAARIITPKRVLIKASLVAKHEPSHVLSPFCQLQFELARAPPISAHKRAEGRAARARVKLAGRPANGHSDKYARRRTLVFSADRCAAADKQLFVFFFRRCRR